ncbi:hypothetical protein Amsp01_087530 [Amycolatopsis sp. NBRC 101858]|uniref:hypothetical protein n=1 Tax=Amycolatopsis sp. NBRC 101858 TaxID=3032200 RepID=UPI0024A41363|nr:hypothetical protein [Amycolatopsis sp. NBRC 101858]GLY42730.1 hypothetical protein Amsp01_087530 [Amycolatopsis sp. NBRC 101858]
MLIPVPPPAIALAGTTDPILSRLVNLTPDYSAGRRLHALYVNKLQSALPGRMSQLIGTGPTFRSVFFPRWKADPLSATTDATGLGSSWWRDFSVAVLCQAIEERGSSIRGQMLSDKITTDVASFNAILAARSARAYVDVLTATFEPLSALLGQVNPATAKQQFHDLLLDNVLTWQLWYQAGMWTSPDWELFNQYAKYIALGATDAEVDMLIGELAAAGLPVPRSVAQEGWRSYAEELRDKPAVDVADIIGACAGPIAASTVNQPIGSSATPISTPNGNCFEFTAHGQPGAPYRRVPGGSCFTGDTTVLDGTGRAVPIRDVRPGDAVLTRDGTATVAYVAKPLHAGRPLYRLTGGGPVFTGTHPFVNADKAGTGPELLAVTPAALAWDVPTLSEHGIGTLRTGSLIEHRDVSGRRSPAGVTVSGVEEVPHADAGTYLYDLRLVTKPGVAPEFWAGDGKSFHLVTPEHPRFEDAGPAAEAVAAVTEGLLGAGHPDEPGWHTRIVDTVNRFGTGIVHDALTRALATTPSFGTAEARIPLESRIDRLHRGLGNVPAETAAVGASLFDTTLGAVGQWLASVVALGWRTAPVPAGEITAVTVFDIVLTPDSPLGPDQGIRLDVTVTDRRSAATTSLWDRRGRANTRFHRYFDQIIHLDTAEAGGPGDLSFTVTAEGATIPVLSAEVPEAIGSAALTLQSAPLRDARGVVVGTVRFDTRRLDPDTASGELTGSGRWTETTARAYANAVGAAMVEPILAGLAAPARKPGSQNSLREPSDLDQAPATRPAG